MPAITLSQHRYTDAAELEALLRAMANAEADDLLVLWPGREPGPALETLARYTPPVRMIALPENTLLAAEALPTSVPDRTIFTYSYELATNYNPHKFRVRAWVHSRRLKVSHPRLQYQTFYALTLIQYGLLHLLSDFHRDYFIARYLRAHSPRAGAAQAGARHAPDAEEC